MRAATAKRLQRTLQRTLAAEESLVHSDESKVVENAVKYIVCAREHDAAAVAADVEVPPRGPPA